MRINRPEIFVSPKRGRFIGYRRLPQFAATQREQLDVHLIGLWWFTCAWFAPAKLHRL